MRRLGRLLGVFAAVLLLAGATAGGAAYWFGYGPFDGYYQTADTPGEEPRFVGKTRFQKLPLMLIGLRGGGQVQLSLQIVVGSDAGKTDVKRSSPQVMAAVRNVIRNQPPGAFENPEKVEAMRDDLIARVSESLDNAEVKGVLFDKLMLM